MGILIGIITSIILVVLFLLNVKHMTKKKFIIICCLLVLGAIGSYVCYRLEMHFGGYFKKVAVSNYFEILFYAFFGVAIFEEGYKWFVTRVLSFFDHSKESYDLVSYSIFTSIGFLTFENIVYYIIPYGMQVAVSRIYTSVLSHICFAIIMGFFFMQSFHSKKKFLYIGLSLFVPTFVHAYYNSFLYGGKYTQFFTINYILILIITVILFIRINLHKKD